MNICIYVHKHTNTHTQLTTRCKKDTESCQVTCRRRNGTRHRLLVNPPTPQDTGSPGLPNPTNSQGQVSHTNKQCNFFFTQLTNYINGKHHERLWTTYYVPSELLLLENTVHHLIQDVFKTFDPEHYLFLHHQGGQNTHTSKI